MTTDCSAQYPSIARARRTGVDANSACAQREAGDAVVAFQRGDEQAFPVLVARFSKMMSCVARRYLTTDFDVQDAVQEAWVSFVRSAKSIETPMAIGGWLCVTTARAALNIAQRQARCRPSDTLFEQCAATSDNGDDLSDDRVRAVMEAVSRLDRHDRELLELLFSAGLSYVEIAHRTGRAIGGIGPTRMRIISKLQNDRAIRRLVTAS